MGGPELRPDRVLGVPEGPLHGGGQEQCPRSPVEKRAFDARP
jgi:hypothetical protein